MNDYDTNINQIYETSFILGYRGNDSLVLDSTILELGKWIKTQNVSIPKGMKLIEAIEYALIELSINEKIILEEKIIKLSKFEKMIEKSKGDAIVDNRQFQHLNQCKNIEDKWCRKWILGFAAAVNPQKWMKKRELYNRKLRFTS